MKKKNKIILTISIISILAIILIGVILTFLKINIDQSVVKSGYTLYSGTPNFNVKDCYKGNVGKSVRLKDQSQSLTFLHFLVQDLT